MVVHLEHKITKVSDLKIGNEIAEDIFMRTPFPLFRKGMKVTTELFEVFRAFHITEVPIVVHNPFGEEVEAASQIIETIQEEVIPKNNKDNIEDLKALYLKAVADYKREFLSWQSGVKLDITKIRQIILPLFERVEKTPHFITMLNEYSNAKEYIFHHAVAQGIITASLAKKMKVEKTLLPQIAVAAALSDCGMAKMDPRILEKSDALTQNEFNEVKKHPIQSFAMVKDTPLLRQDMKLAILQHHERLDGSGYPKGEKMNNISTFAQYIAVADIYHAMTSERVYRPKTSSFKVLEMIREDEFGKFDILVVQALLAIIGDLATGLRIELSTGEIAEVMFNQMNTPTRPVIRLVQTGEILDLSKNRHMYIEKIIG